MIKIQGKRNSAVVYAEKIDKETKTQLAELLRDTSFTDSKIRIMPDAHTGKACIVGTTMTLHGRINPSLVGVDIGCGIETVVFNTEEIDLPMLDRLIHAQIPSGSRVNERPLAQAKSIDLSRLRCFAKINAGRAYQSIGTLGGGNHFIEVDKDNDGNLYLIIHSGSRQLGNDIARYYQEAAYRHQYKKARRNARRVSGERDEAYEDCLEQYAKRKRQEKKALGVTFGKAVLEGALFDDYLHDISIAQKFAHINRRAIAEIIREGMGLHEVSRFSNVHNYIDVTRMIMRKGAVSANLGEQLTIPLNMRDGALICTGLGNPDWNFSAPHGAGRVCSRTDAKYTYSVDEFQEQMKGIYTTTAQAGSLDECPMAYKAPEGIIAAIGDTVSIEKRVRPIYNFKACS